MKRTSSTLFVFIVILSLIATYVYRNQPKITTNKAAEKSSAIVKDVLHVDVYYNRNNHPPLTVINTEKRKNIFLPEHKPSTSSINKSFSLVTIDRNGDILNSTTFYIPEEMHDDLGPLRGDKNSVNSIIIPEYRTTASILLSPEAYAAQIRTSEGQIMQQITIPTTSTADSLPTDEQTVRKLQADAQGYYHITFIGDNYDVSQIPLFHADVERIKQRFFTFEPFKSRQNVFQFHVIDNTQDLECAHSTYTQRLIYCNDSILRSLVRQELYPTHQILVIYNDDEYGGGAFGTYATTYNGLEMEPVAVHELGHTIGGLRDEYSYGTTGFIDGYTHENCYAGTPPASEWTQDAIDITDYSLVCANDNWYRSSPTSIMQNLYAPFFNVVSIRLLNARINAVLTPSPTITPCGKKIFGDSNCDNIINLRDFETWRNEFLSQSGLSADFDSSGTVNIYDFEIWRTEFVNQLQ